MDTSTTRGFLRVVVVAGALALGSGGVQAQLIPAPTAGAKPTLDVAVDHGAPGDPIAISGSAPPGASGVRVQWLRTSATEPTVEVGLAGGQYAATVKVPDDATPGPVLLCAGLTDVTPAELACVDFAVQEPAPAIVSGKLPPIGAVSTASARVAATGLNPWANTTLNLVKSNGLVVATTVPAASGQFAFAPVPPGNYALTQTGSGVKSVAPTSLFAPSGETVITKSQLDLIAGTLACSDEHLPLAIDNMGMAPTAAASNASFGTYISGVSMPVHIFLDPVHDMFYYVPRLGDPPPATGLQAVRYDIVDAHGHLFSATGNNSALAATFDIGQLSPGVATITPVPIVNGHQCVVDPKFRRTIRMVANPVGSFARLPDSTIVWHGGFSNDGFYRFNVIAPEIPELPLSFPSPPITEVPFVQPPIKLPFVVRNEFDASTALKAEVKLDGETTFKTASANFTFVILDETVLDEGASFTPPGNIHVNFLEPRKSSIDINLPSLLPIHQEFTLYEGTILDLFGLVQVIGALTAGFEGDVGLFTNVKPFVPALSIRVVPEVAALGSVSAGLGAVNFVSGGATLNTTLGVAVPFFAQTDPPDVGVDDPCIELQASANLFVRLSAGPITLLKISTPKYPIVLPAGIPLFVPGPCSAPSSLTAGIKSLEAAVPLLLTDDGIPAALPAVNPAPSVAVSAAGDRLRVYVDDATAGTDTITPRIVAQIQNPATDAWGALTPITDGSHFVADPVVAWAGTGAGKIAVAAWSERPTTLAEDIAIDDDIAALLDRQEIYLATFQGGAWSAPVRLTNDLLADGNPAIAGDSSGYSLVWVSDQDGNPATRTDVRLKVRETLLAGGVTSSLIGSGNEMSVEPSVVRRNGETVIAYTRDYDPMNPRSFYRRVTLARGSSGSFTIDEINSLPYFTDSPSLAITDDAREWLAFLLRGMDDDGVSEIGNFGTRAHVTTATRSGPNAPWQLGIVSNADGGGPPQDDRGETPLIVATGNKAGVVFRSFEINSQGFGQLMLTRLQTGFADNRFSQITFGDKQRWFPTATIDPTTGELVVVSLDLPGKTPAPDDYALITTRVAGLADPAVFALEPEPPFADPGQTVSIRTTVENLGLADTPLNQLTLDVLDGPPGTGSVVASQPLSGGTLRFGQSTTAFVDVTASAGAQKVWVRVRSTGSNADTSNDVLTVDLRSLPAPLHVQVNPAAGALGALDVSWLGALTPLDLEPGDPVPAATIGYRIERSDTAGGPRELAGESTSSAFRDALLQIGQQYCYVVTAYDGTGVVSPPSDEVCTATVAVPPSLGTPLLGTSLRIAANPEKPTSSSFSFTSKDPALGTGLVPGSEADPVLHGATVRIGSGFSETFDGVYDLPARNWKYLQKHGVTQGYKYSVKRGDPAVPVKSMVITLGQGLRAAARGAEVTASLTGNPSPVNVEVAVGSQSYCMQFGGTTKHTPDRSFSGRKAPAPKSCPLRPD